MREHKKQKKTLLRYWTTRYFITLLVGLLIVSAISLIWIWKSSFNQRVENMENMAQIIAYQASGNGSSRDMMHQPEERPMVPFGEHYIYQLDKNGEIMYRSSSSAPSFTFPSSFLEDENRYTQFDTDDKSYIAVVKEVTDDQKLLGYIVLFEEKIAFFQWRNDYGFMLILIGIVAIFGWGVVYGLTRNLSDPIIQVAEASKSIAKGQYEVTLPAEKSQLEVNELIESFQTMATRLRNLEKLRSELLAGVTHELKTPVTSISGLLQAVQDGTVTGEEAEIFLENAFEETERMKVMVSDLLELNSFSASDVPLKLYHVSFYKEVESFINSFVRANYPTVNFRLAKKGEDVLISVDINRLKQVITNVINNAMTAVSKQDAKLQVHLQTDCNHASIIITDNGKGIPEEEQPFIFEKFFRGENKKYKQRGLGIGLYFSKVLMQAMGGYIKLLKSVPGETTFLVELPVYEER